MKISRSLLTVVALAVFTTGCKQQSESIQNDEANKEAKDHGHGHTHANSMDEHSQDRPPHNGTLTDWGGGAYHIEFVVDRAKKEATVYILGGDAKTPEPIKTEKIQLQLTDPATEIELSAKPLDGEDEGGSSRFVGTNDALGNVKKFSGSITGMVDGTPYSGDFKEEPHDTEHGHARGHEHY